ncbi:hydroxyethylthiazole kinase [Lacticaseibacillus daqingensis]|uniref:hydroxyethylthiazole kinase n=1 Tax=Lacticaseibacillus daqingensis TaxID=2486014 RepID=UPI000F788B47|nr:hydroxyethylthiazole kinase [Lacticaseibacillus daqingensis]
MNSELLAQLQAQHPLVVNYANFVTPGFVANGLNALGASPIMTLAQEEALALMIPANALVLNLGTINTADMPLVLALAEAAASLAKPIVLDPVAVGATAFRAQAAERLLRDYPITVIRGNAGEIAFLAGIEATAKGIDAGATAEAPATLAQRCAARYDCTVVVSGPIDVIATGHNLATVYNQTPLLPAVVGSGDLLSSLIGAYLGLTTDPFEAALVGAATLGVAGEIAASHLQATQAGTFAANLMDALAGMTTETLNQRARYEAARHA